jgi:hypothetical protein
MVMFDNGAKTPRALSLDAVLASEPGHPMLAALDTFGLERSPGLQRSVGLEVGIMKAADLGEQAAIGSDTRALSPIAPGVVAALRYLQHPTEPRDVKLLLVRFDERVPHGNSLAKYAAAFRCRALR